MEKITPWMQQFYSIKESYKDCVLFFRMWDFYEMFDEDAEVAHKVLWIAITSRNKNSKTPTPLAWIPFHAKEKYLPLLVNAWYKVAIAEQVSDPKLKWIVKREVVRVVTPATLSLEWDWYEGSSENNYIVSISEKEWIFWLSYVNFSDNKWKTSEFKRFDELATQLYKIWPKEVILGKELFNNSEIKDILSKKYALNIYFFEASKNPRKILLEHFWIRNLEWFWIENKLQSQNASAQLLEYISQNQKSSLSFLNSLSYETFSWKMYLDESTIKSLDLIYNYSTKSSSVWTLFWVLNQTKTSAWARYLREQILKPLQDINEINQRLDFIEEFTKDTILLDKVREKLKNISDINSILNRLALNRAMPRDLLNLKRSLIAIVEINELIENEWSKKLKKILD